MREWGWTNPVLIDENGTIIAGHGRVSAARKLGINEVPVMIATGWTEAQKKAYTIADNQLALNAAWNLEALSTELHGLEELRFDLGLLGFDDLAGLMVDKTTGLTDPDEAPEPPVNPASVLGDVWLLGRHRLVCGDATSADDVAKALNGVTPHLMVTDPPYGVEFDPTWRKGSEKRTYMGDMPDREGIWREAWTLFPGDVVYIWHAAKWMAPLIQCLDEVGFDLRSQIIWNKMRFIIGRGNYSYNHDPCFYGVRKGRTAHWTGSNNQPTVWDIQHRLSYTNHGAQKPVECMRRPIENNSNAGQAIYEPFVGSGTTIIAAEMTGRACHALEISPAYVDVTVQRWQAFTSKQATLEADGRTFDEVSQARYDAKARSDDYEESCVVGTAEMRNNLMAAS
jgi:DNA modification methylase